MKKLILLLLCLFSALAIAQSTRRIGQVNDYNITSFPLYGALVTPDDAVALTIPGAVRADAAGAVTVICWGNGTTAITLNMVAGEFVPCLVKLVKDTGTDAIVLHVFY